MTIPTWEQAFKRPHWWPDTAKGHHIEWGIVDNQYTPIAVLYPRGIDGTTTSIRPITLDIIITKYKTSLSYAVSRRLSDLLSVPFHYVLFQISPKRRFWVYDCIVDVGWISLSQRKMRKFLTDLHVKAAR